MGPWSAQLVSNPSSLPIAKWRAYSLIVNSSKFILKFISLSCLDTMFVILSSKAVELPNAHTHTLVVPDAIKVCKRQGCEGV